MSVVQRDGLKYELNSLKKRRERRISLCTSISGIVIVSRRRPFSHTALNLVGQKAPILT